MVTVAKTVLGIHVMNVAADQDAAAREEAPAGVLIRAINVKIMVTDMCSVAMI